jgi:hypothetical protein
MSSQPDLQPPQPPRIAGWLLMLFTPPAITESIVGDLLEEFSGLVIKSGLAFARRWYWRQTLRTIAHAGGSAVSSAPWLIFISILGGLWLIGFATRSSAHAMQVFLDARRLYESHPSAYLFWLKFPLEIGRVILCGLVGVVVALASKRMEMITVIAISLVQIALFLTAVVAVIARGEAWSQWFIAMLPWNGLCSIATVAGGVIVRTWRHRTETRSSAA